MFTDSPFGNAFDDDLPMPEGEGAERHAVLGSGDDKHEPAGPGPSQAFGISSLSQATAAAFGIQYQAHLEGACACPACSSPTTVSTAPGATNPLSGRPAASTDTLHSDATVVASTAFGNDYVDGILWGTNWTGSLTFSFADSMADFGSPYPHTFGGLQQVTPMQQAATRAIFGGDSAPAVLPFLYGSYSDVSNLQISIAADPFGHSDLVIAEVDTMNGSNVPTARVVEFPDTDQRISGGDVVYGNDNNGIYRTPLPGNFAWATHIHEYGHALGLSHAHSPDGTFAKTIPADRLAEEFSVMSYATVPNDFINGYNNEQWGHPQTLMQMDILAIQHLYGPNYSTNSGNTTYSWSTTTGEMFVNGVGQGQPGGGHPDANKVFLTVWDGGGIDTYDASNYANDMHLDLMPGWWSRISDAQTAVKGLRQQIVGQQPSEAHVASGNVYNAYMFNGDQRSLIENGYGGSGSDWVEGNIGDNELRGNDGNDTVNGREGDDTLAGGAGNDTLFGDKREGGPDYDGPSHLFLPVFTANNSIQTAFDLTPYAGRVETPSVRDSATHPHVSVQVDGDGNGQDFFKVVVPGPGLIVLDIDFTQNFNAYMGLFGPTGALLSSSDNSGVDNGSAQHLNNNGNLGSEDPHIVFNVSDPGTYFIVIDDFLGRGVYQNARYTLSITLPNHDESPASEGNDVLAGGLGVDSLLGQGGDDTLNGGAGADDLDGGPGFDTASYESASTGVTVRIDSGQGYTGEANGDTLTSIENLTGSGHDDVLIGNQILNVLRGGGGSDDLRGNAGNDTLVGGAGSDTLEGGTGADTASYEDAASGVIARLDTGEGYAGEAAGDRLTSIENLIGSAHADILIGSAGANDIEGGSGEDDLRGNAGNDDLSGGADSDTLDGGVGADDLNGGAGFDTASYESASSGVTVRIDSGQGYTGEANGDTLTSIENLTGSDHNDILVGNQILNVLRGGGGSDDLRGNAGNDTLVGGTSSDTLDGGVGADTAGYDGAASGVIVRLDTAVGYTGEAAGDQLISIENLIGSAHADILVGSAGANDIQGGSGEDDLRGNAGNDDLSGDADNDTLSGGTGADDLNGGAGFDTASYQNASSGVTVRIDSGLGYTGEANGDTLTSIENLTGSDHGDVLIGNHILNELRGGGGNDDLRGNGGNDTLTGGTGADTLEGGTGSDTAAYDGAASGLIVRLDTGLGYTGEAAGDQLISIENLIGSAHADILIGNGGANMLEGGSGADDLRGNAGTDTASYRSSAAGVIVRLDTAAGYTGDAAGDSLTSIENLYGSANADHLIGNAGGNRLDGAGGDDVLRGGVGADTMVGGDGFDIAEYVAASAGVIARLDSGLGYGGEAASDVLAALEGLRGSGHADVLVGDASANLLEGGGGNDQLRGEGGNDTLAGGVGADTLNGSTGDDMASFAGASGGVIARLDSGLGYGGEAAGDVYDSIEGMTGSAYADVLIGDAGGNRLEGDRGNDQLRGEGGNDTLVGGVGADTLNGGSGRDMASYDGATSGVIARLDSGLGYAGEAAGDVLTAVEDLGGSGHADTLVGDGAGNLMLGGADNDQLRGEGGNDTLVGGADDDTLTGGAGQDVFVFGNSAGDDVIADFAGGAGAGDVIDLSDNGHLSSFASVQGASSQSGADTVIDLGGGSSLTLESFTASNLAADDFIF